MGTMKFKNYKIDLHSTMSDERLSSLGIISLWYEVARPLDFHVLVDKFAQKKGRRKNFFK